MYNVNMQNIASLSVLLLSFLVAITVKAYQPDAPFQEALQENAGSWAKEDEAIDARLAQLEQRYWCG